MPSRTYEFTQIDVFTQMPLAGNPLAIFPDARGLDDAEMQALAREMNLSETTFIFPRDAATEAREGTKVRIFTVETELPFAGHPTLGTALYLYASESHQQNSAEISLHLKAGKIPVRFTADSGNTGRERVDGSVFGEMRQRDPEFGTPLSRDDVARVIGIAVDEIPSEWLIQPVSTGTDVHSCSIPRSTDALGSKVCLHSGSGVSEENRCELFLLSFSRTARRAT